MRIASRHVFRCVISRFVTSISLLAIDIGGAADEFICCPIDSELATVKYGSVRAAELAWVDIELPRAVDWTKSAESDELGNDGYGESSCANGRYEPVPSSTPRSGVFGFVGAELRVEPEGDHSGRLKLRVPIRMYGHHYSVDDTGTVYFGGSSGKVHTRLHLANLQGNTISMRANYLLDDELAGCASTLEFDIQSPAVDAGRQGSEDELQIQRASPRS